MALRAMQQASALKSNHEQAISRAIGLDDTHDTRTLVSDRLYIEVTRINTTTFGYHSTHL